MWVSIFGMVHFKAPLLPYLFLLVTVMLRGNIYNETFGIIVGHTYYFLYFIVPKLPPTWGFNILEAPRFIKYITDFLGLDSKRELILEEGDFIEDEDFDERFNNL